MNDGEHGSAERQEDAEGWRRFVPPLWTLGFPLLAAAGLAAWRTANAAEGDSALSVFSTSLLWPGAIAFGVVLVVVVLGWTLDID